MERDEILARTCTAILPCLAGSTGAAASTSIIATVCYVTAAIGVVQIKYYLRRRR